MNRRLLFLAYYFAPHHAVASVRTTSLARALADLGWRVTVLTVDETLLIAQDKTLLTHTSGAGSLEIVRTAHGLPYLFPSALKSNNHGFRRLAFGTLRVLARKLGIEREIGWRQPAHARLQAFQSHAFDVILSSGGPWISHALAAAFGRKHKRPYVLDYRDLWCGNPHGGRPASRREQNREKDLRNGAAAITAVSPSILAVQASLYGKHAFSSVITNGYQESLVHPAEQASRKGFVALYAGQFYPPKSTVDPFLKAVQLLRRRHPATPICFHYMGPSADYVRQVAGEDPTSAGVVIQDRQPRSQALEALGRADVALVAVLNGEIADRAEAGIITGKIFEIFAARRPYAVVASRNSDLHDIVATAGGGRIFTSTESEAMALYLEEVMLGRPTPYRHPEQFSWSTLAEKMDRVLTAACESSD